MIAQPTADPASTLPEWVYGFRMHLGLTQSEFADLIDVHVSSVQRYEYGTQVPPGPAMKHLAYLAEGYGYGLPPGVSQRAGPRPRK